MNINEINTNKIHNSGQGQVTLEYFILFAVMALLTLVGVSTFGNDIRDSLQRFFDHATAQIAH